jgi:hypothetical protein
MLLLSAANLYELPRMVMHVASALGVTGLCCALLWPLPADAQAYKCRTADGRILIADQPCAGGSRTEAVIAAEPVSEAAQQEAEARRQREAAFVAQQAKKAAEAEAETARRTAQNTAGAGNEAVRACVADVQHSNASDSVKLDLIAACQNAGLNRQRRQIDEDGVQECLRNVSRLRADDAETARAIAACHGADLPAGGGGTVVRVRPGYRVPPGRQPLSGAANCPPGVSVCPPSSGAGRSVSPRPAPSATGNLIGSPRP